MAQGRCALFIFICRTWTSPNNHPILQSHPSSRTHPSSKPPRPSAVVRRGTRLRGRLAESDKDRWQLSGGRRWQRQGRQPGPGHETDVGCPPFASQLQLSVAVSGSICSFALPMPRRKTRSIIPGQPPFVWFVVWRVVTIRVLPLQMCCVFAILLCPAHSVNVPPRILSLDTEPFVSAPFFHFYNSCCAFLHLVCLALLLSRVSCFVTASIHHCTHLAGKPSSPRNLPSACPPPESMPMQASSPGCCRAPMSTNPQRMARGRRFPGRRTTSTKAC